MEIIIVVIFVQSFVWATLLFKQPSKLNSSLAVSFLSLSLIYILLYISTLFEKQIPENLAPTCTILLALSVSFYQLKNLHLSLSKTAYVAVWLLLAASVLVLGYCVWTGIETESYWMGIALLATATFIYDVYAFIKRLKKKTVTGSFFEDTQLKLSAMLLLDKLLVLLFASFILFSPYRNENSSSSIRNSFQFLVAILAFITGYIAVTASFHIEVQKKRNSIKNKDRKIKQGLIEKISCLMQEQKPYLNCELTLQKMAEMLEVSDNELTRLLNHEMDTSFYKLVNDYRIETVLKKLKDTDNRKFTIMASAYESGFNSKSTFYRIFKEYTRMTPKEYLSND